MSFRGRMRHLAIAGAFVLAACGGPTPSAAPTATPEPPAGPRIWCDDPRAWGQPPTLTCEEAVGAAVPMLPTLHPTIVAIDFHFGIWCPPNARCAAPMPDVGHVIVHFAAGPPLLVRVTEDPLTGIVSGEPAATFPPGQEPAPIGPTGG